MRKILFAHSAGAQYGKGKGSYDLVQYLKKKLGKDYKILFPKIERPNAPTYKKYKKLFKDTFTKLQEPVIVIGHSLGGSSFLKYLSEEKTNIDLAGLFLVSVPKWGPDMKEFQLKENFQNSLPKIPSVFLYHSKNDPIVPFKQMNFYKEAFKKATVRELPGKDHVFEIGLPVLVRDIISLA